MNGASLLPDVVPGSWAAVKGTNLANTTAFWDSLIVNGKLPTSLGGVSLTIGGQSAFPYYVSPGQINWIVPDVGVGPQSVVVSTPNGVAAAFITTVRLYGPAFFAWPNNQVVATRTNFTYVAAVDTFQGLPTIPAKPGEVLILWGTGFGPTLPPTTPGFLVPADRTYNTSIAPLVTINNLPVTVYGTALASGYAGLYQVAIQVPEGLTDGTWPVRATIGGQQSPVGFVLTVKR